MAASKSTATPVQYIKNKRFTTEQHGYELWYISLGLSGNIAVSGHHKNSRRTFIDLYFGGNSDSRDKLKLMYSKEFAKYSNYLYRCVSLLDKNGSGLLVTCIGNKIEIIDTKNKSKVLPSCRVNGETWCLAVREGEIFIGLWESQTVIVFNNDLKETKKIKLKGMEDDYPWDLQVTKDTVFVHTSYGRVLSIAESNGSIITEYTYTTGTYRRTNSITVSKRLGLVAVLWGDRELGGHRIIVYSLNENKSFLVFNVDSNVHGIRISDRDRMIITGNKKTGEIKMYDLEQLFSFEAMKRTLAYIVSPDECEELRKYFGIREEELRRRGVGDESKTPSEEKMECLLTIIEEKGHLNPYHINNLTDAVSTLGDEMYVSNLRGPMEGYFLHGIEEENVKNLMAEMMTRQKAWKDERNQLSSKLETAESKVKEQERTLDDLQGELVRGKKQSEEQEKTWMEDLRNAEEKIEELQGKSIAKIESTNKIERLTAELNETKQKLVTRIKELGTANKDLEVTKQDLQETKQDRDITRTELKQYQLDFAKESKALKEVLNQEREMEKKHLVDSEETTDGGVSILAAEFGRLNVGIAEYLTLDHCLKLATLFNVPPCDCDLLRRVSFIESPGIKLLDLLRTRNVINMYDVTNLQKGFLMVYLGAVNNDVLVPYQESIDDNQYKLHKAEEMFTWEDIRAFVNTTEDTARHQKRDSHTSPNNDTEPNNTSHQEANVQLPDRAVEDRGSIRPHQLYIEKIIGKEGGKLHIANVALTIPPDALDESHVIAFTVINESPFALDRDVDTARMTPIIKLEPLGLEFKKSVKLNIPHSDLIPAPENHDVIIYSGEISKNKVDSSECIQWTVEKSLPRQLKEKYVSIDVQCLSYLSASLDSQTTVPSSFIVRVVAFVDGVRGASDDITLTICFCSDNDSEYYMLLSDYKTKLPLEEYSTLHLRRHSERNEDDAGFLSVTVTSANNTYVPDAEQAVKSFAVSHLCTASRVSQQIRLKKNEDTDRDIVDTVVTFSQAEYKPTKISLKARIKDLIVSQESEDVLIGFQSPALQPYEDLKDIISSMLDKTHCAKLATYFELSPAERERIDDDSRSGRMLIKILDEREKIMPQKMIYLFQGLKDCHLDKIARPVSEYIDKNTEQTRQEEQQLEKKKTKESLQAISAPKVSSTKQQIRVRSRQRDRSVQTTLSSTFVSFDVHVRTLNEVAGALDIAKDRLLSTGKALLHTEVQPGKQ